MQRRDVLRKSGLVATAGLTGLAGCSSDGGSTDKAGDDGSTAGDQSTGTSSGESSTTNTVLMATDGGNYYFDPIGLSVDAGETVTFEIKSGSHSATAYKEGTGPATVTRIPDGAKAFNSEILSEQGATYEHTFETEGTYDYFCIPHKSLGMVGRIVVGEPGGPAEGSMPPDGNVPESQTIVEKGSVSFEEFSG